MVMDCPELYFSRSILSNDLDVSWSRRSFTHLAESVYRVYAPPDFNHSEIVIISMSLNVSEVVLFQGFCLSVGRK